MKKVLVTGGGGMLGGEIKKIAPDFLFPTRAELEITDLSSVLDAFERHRPDVVLHMAAATKPPEHEKDPEPGLMSNIVGTSYVALAAHRFEAKMVYISTDYMYIGNGPHRETESITSPSRFVWSKVGGECAVRLLHNFLILRLSFGPAPFPWDRVYEGQYNSKLYVDEIAPLVVAAANSDARGIMNIGGPRTSLEEYARRTRGDIQTITRPEWVPVDTSLDIAFMKQELGISDETKLIRHRKNGV